jgi:hypothetical protein
MRQLKTLQHLLQLQRLRLKQQQLQLRRSLQRLQKQQLLKLKLQQQNSFSMKIHFGVSNDITLAGWELKGKKQFF